MLATQDLYLHIAVGRWIIENRQVPGSGILSGTASDAPWLAHEWLASLGFAGIYELAGWSGVVIAAALAMALAIGIVAFEVRRAAGPIAALGCAVLSWGLCLGHMLARPHLLTLPLFTLWIVAHVRAREREGVPPLYLALAMILWANLHGGFLIGLVFSLLFAAEAVYAADNLQLARLALKRWSIFLVACVLGSLLTPHGVAGLLFPIRLTSMTSALAGITEWQASSLTNNPPLIIALLLLVFVSLSFGLRAPITRIAMLLLLAYMALAHFRYSELLGLAAPLLFLQAFAGTRLATVTSHWGERARPVVGTVLLLLLAIVTASSVAIVVRNPDHGVDRLTPKAAVDWAVAQELRGPVLNAYNFGGYLIFRGIPPFIDGRVELYGEDFVIRDFALDQFIPLLDAYHIAWTIFDPRDLRNVLMGQLPNWRRAYADAEAIIYVRRD